MRKLISIFLILPALLLAQEGTNKPTVIALAAPEITVTIGVNSSETIWFALPPSVSLPARPAVDTSAAVNPPDRVSWNGNTSLYITKTSGNASDSSRILAQPIDETGALIDNRDQYLTGGASTFGSVFSDADVKQFSMSGLFDLAFGFKFTFTQGDLSGGNRVYKVKLITQ